MHLCAEGKLATLTGGRRENASHIQHAQTKKQTHVAHTALGPTVDQQHACLHIVVARLFPPLPPLSLQRGTLLSQPFVDRLEPMKRVEIPALPQQPQQIRHPCAHVCVCVCVAEQEWCFMPLGKNNARARAQTHTDTHRHIT